MKQRAAAAVEALDRLSLRERLFVLAALVAVLVAAWEALLAGPLEAREQRAAAEVASLEQRLNRLNDELATTAAGMSAGVPGRMDRLHALEEARSAGARELDALTNAFVEPREIRALLEELLRGRRGLTLVSAANLDAEPLLERDAAGAVAVAVSDEPQLYRHTLRLELRGSFHDCLAYLEAAERLPWRLHWARMEIDAREYPDNVIVLELDTLSRAAEWIGV
jgi:MSHA biogenesis protein MshJ